MKSSIYYKCRNISQMCVDFVSLSQITEQYIVCIQVLAFLMM